MQHVDLQVLLYHDMIMTELAAMKNNIVKQKRNYISLFGKIVTFAPQKLHTDAKFHFLAVPPPLGETKFAKINFQGK